MKKGNISYDTETGIYRIGETAINQDALVMMKMFNEEGDSCAALVQSRLLDMIANNEFDNEKDQFLVTQFIGIINRNAQIMRALYLSANPDKHPFDPKS